MLNRMMWRSGARRATFAAAAILLSACSVDKVLQVPDPDVSRPTDVSGTLSAGVSRRSAAGRASHYAQLQPHQPESTWCWRGHYVVVCVE